MLHLVEDEPRGVVEAGEEADRVVGGLLTEVELLQRQVAGVGEGGARQGRLPGLSGTGEEDRRELTGELDQTGGQGARGHGD